jgi:hypothetical protein
VEQHWGGETEELGAFNGGEMEAARCSLWGSETHQRVVGMQEEEDDMSWATQG